MGNIPTNKAFTVKVWNHIRVNDVDLWAVEVEYSFGSKEETLSHFEILQLFDSKCWQGS